jgi:hypothetical protein
MPIFQAMLRNLNVGCVVAQRNAPSTIQGALAFGVTHPTVDLYFFIYMEFFSPTYLPFCYKILYFSNV